MDAIAQAGSGVGAVPGSFAANAGQMATQVANSVGLSTAEAATLGSKVLEGTALLGGLSGVAQSAAQGDPLGIAAGVLEAGAAVAGGLVSAGTLDGAAAAFARKVSVGAGLASMGAGSADAFAHGDLAGGLLASLNALLAQVAHVAFDPAAPTPTKPPGTAPAGNAGGGGTGPFDGPGVDGTAKPPATTPAAATPGGTTPGGTATPGAGVTGPPVTAAGTGPAAPAGSFNPGGGVFDGAGVDAAGPPTGSDGATPPASAGPAFVDPHPAPDGGGSWTNLSDADYARFKAGLPPGGDASGTAGTLPTITVTAPAGGGLAATAVLAGGTVAAGAAEGTLFALAGSGLARLAATTAGQALLRLAGVVLAPEFIAAGTAVYLGYKGVQLLIDRGALPPLPGFSPPPPVPTSPPPLVAPPAGSPPEALVPPPVPGQAGNEGFTATPALPGNEGLVPPDGLQGPQIFESRGDPGLTQPTGPIDGVPTGPRSVTEQDAASGRKAQVDSENQVADKLATMGYQVVQNPMEGSAPVLTPERMTAEGLNPSKNPDLLIGGRVFDTYTPVVDDASTIRSGIASKVDAGQTQRVVVDLRNTTQTEASLRAALQAQPIPGLKEVIILNNDGFGKFFRP